MLNTFERRWRSVTQTPIQVSNFVITMADTRGFHPKMKVTLSLIGITSQEFEVKRVTSPTTLSVGPIGASIDTLSNPIQFNNGMIQYSAGPRHAIDMDAQNRAMYQEEPTVARRVFQVDYWGQDINSPESEVSSADATSLFLYGPSQQLLYIREFAPTAALGDPLKVTAFEYNSSLQVIKINSYAATVTQQDLDT